MGWLFFSFDKPLFITQQDPLELWPSILVCIGIYVIRFITNRTLEPIGKYLTDYKIDHEKPEWLISNSQLLSSIKQQNIKNGTTGYAQQHHKTAPVVLTESQQTELISVINTLRKNELKTLLDHASDLKLSNVQRRELQSFFTLVKDYDTHKHKFLESTFKLICIVPIAVYGAYVVYFKHDFFINPWKMWVHVGDDLETWEACNFDLSREPLTQVYDNWMTYYYIISFGYHLNRTVTQFHNPARKDFWALVIHHWSTLTLILCSWMGGGTRVGCVTLNIHESSDIFLESAKLGGYCSLYWVADIFFVLFFLSWIVFRMFFFCYKLLWETWYCGSQSLWLNNHPMGHGFICIVFLFVLGGLHIFWFRLIMQIVIRKVVGKRISDVRSSGSESEHDGEKPKTE